VAEDAGQVRDEELDAEHEARRRIALAQIRQFPDPVLRMQAREVEGFDDDLARLVERMEHLVREANGIGLAATQVGVVRRVFVFRRTREDDEEEAEADETIAVVNPRIVEKSAEVATDVEGCLSLQGVRVPVERSTEISLEARDPRGSELRLELEGVEARVAQHELDHLDGVLILDRTTPDARREAMAVLRPQVVLDVG
jgi:peptide deformylase